MKNASKIESKIQTILLPLVIFAILMTSLGCIGNNPPVINVSYDKEAPEEKPIKFNASGSYDPDGSITSYEWKEGTTILSNDVSFSKVFSVGVHNITLKVTDNKGASNTSSFLVTVKRSALNDIARVNTYLYNAGIQLTTAGNLLSIGSYTFAKTRIAGAKTNLEEALSILKEAKTDYIEEENDINQINTLLSAYLDMVDGFEYSVIGWEHLEKGLANYETGNYKEAKLEYSKGKEKIDYATKKISSGYDKFTSFNIDLLSPDIRSNISSSADITIMNQNFKYINEMYLALSKMIPGLIVLVEGDEHFEKAVEFLSNKRWSDAELEFNVSKQSYAKGLNIFEELKQSNMTEISVSSIELYNSAKMYINASAHYERGSHYASIGNYYNAESEFKKAQKILGLT